MGRTLLLEIVLTLLTDWRRNTAAQQSVDCTFQDFVKLLQKVKNRRLQRSVRRQLSELSRIKYELDNIIFDAGHKEEGLLTCIS